jgi:hypothetical protein
MDYREIGHDYERVTSTENKIVWDIQLRTGNCPRGDDKANVDETRFDNLPADRELLSRRARDKRFGGQAIKGVRWMPRHQEAMKDVVSCEKLRGAANERRSVDVRMGKPLPI